MPARITAILIPVLSFCAAVSVPAWGCDTPVYRYAMYRWNPSPYELYFFHNDEMPESAKAIQKKIDSLHDDEVAPTNIVVSPINLTADPELKSVPRDVKQAWLKEVEQGVEAPLWMLFTPDGFPIFTGKLTADDVAAICQSDMRKRITADLAKGHACVMVLLSGVKESDGELVEDAAATDKAEAEIKRLVTEVNAGKVDLYKAPKPNDPGAAPEPDAEAASHSISYVRLSRTDAKESWLARCLIGVETDLREFNDPMVFPVYGRGRALPPYMKGGITFDNLLDVVGFVTGACSCTVKEQNPGMDLLVQNDWETAAEKVAERFGAEEGNEMFAAEDFFSDLIIPAEKPDPAAAPAETVARVDPEAGNSETGNPETGNPETVDRSRHADTVEPVGKTNEDVSADEPVDDAAADDPANDRAAKTEPSTYQPSAASADAASDDGAGEATDAAHAPAPGSNAGIEAVAVETRSSLLVVGAGVGIALLVLFGATFLVLSPR